MTVAELYEQVSRLGFESSLEDTKQFYATVNRAALQVNALRPAVRSCKINHTPLPNLLSDSVSPNDTVFIANSPRAFYFEADGTGHYYLEKLTSSEWSVIGEGDLSRYGGKYTAYRGLIKDGGENVDGEVRLRMESEYSCNVRNVALYAAVLSDNEEDIPPFGAYTSYDMNDIVQDFLAFSSPPIKAENGYERMSLGYEIEGRSKILFPTDTGCVYTVLYEHMPSGLVFTSNPQEDTTKIDLDEDLCAALPLLVAAYIWLDDEEGKALHYMDLYREMAVNIVRNRKVVATSAVRDVYGWR